MNKTYEEVGTWSLNLHLRVQKERGANPHCEDGPAYIYYRFDGSIWRDIWFRDGLKHRDDGPALIVYRLQKAFPGDTRTFEELESAGVVLISDGWLNDRRTVRFT